MTTYAYPDAYLEKFCSNEREGRAIADVALMASSAGKTFSADWIERLTVTQCYILACQEEQAAPDDLFASKLKTYRAQMAALLPQAVAAADAEDGTVSSIGIFSVPIFRG